MSARTYEQTVSDNIVKRLRAEGNPNTTFLNDTTVSDSRTNRENAVADEFALDAQITSRKVTAIPTAFDSNDAAICVLGGLQELKDRGIIDKLRTNADVRYIVSYGDYIEDNQIENFVLLSEDRISVGTDRFNTTQGIMRVFKREKVFVD